LNQPRPAQRITPGTLRGSSPSATAITSSHSHWRNFPAIWNERWSFDNVVLIGDALRTAHFPIDSGTRLAMEDSVALFKRLPGAWERRACRP
jgi:2-polyprenyl-6-methoxyphenol hydroxylase-like FAD-dependent oxidoreductase